MQGVRVRSLVGELRSRILWGQKVKTQSRSNIVTSSIKTLKMVHIKKILKKKDQRLTLCLLRCQVMGCLTSPGFSQSCPDIHCLYCPLHGRSRSGSVLQLLPSSESIMVTKTPCVCLHASPGRGELPPHHVKRWDRRTFPLEGTLETVQSEPLFYGTFPRSCGH